MPSSTAVPHPIRSAAELETMRESGRVVALALEAVRAAAVPGVKLRDLDDIARTALHEAGAESSFFGYAPAWAPTAYKGVLCLSPNEVVVHGPPTGRRVADGDVLSIDFGAAVDGWHGDAAITVHIGSSTEEDRRLVAATEEALAAGVAAAVPGATLLDVATAIDAVATRHGFAHLPDHGGHGIGRAMHEAPFVPNQPLPGARDQRLEAGHTLAIEPMLLAGSSEYRTARDGWSVVTRDRRRAAHAEHTVAVTDDGPLVLTAP